MFKMNYSVEFTTEGKSFSLATLSEIEITNSVENLADTAIITLPESVLNKPLDLEDKIKRGSEVLIKLGYDDALKNEFKGFVKDIQTNDGSITINCEDAIFQFRKGIKNIQLKSTSIKKILEYVVSQIDNTYIVDADDYDIGYEKFTIHQTEGYDILKKLQEETSANVYFDTVNKIMHFHPPYIQKLGEVVYSMQHNIESSSLEYLSTVDKKFELTVEQISADGTIKKFTKGTPGGDTKTIKISNTSDVDIEKIMDATLKKNHFDGYKGTFDTWLLPYCQASYSADITDAEYPEKTGRYYVSSVVTSFSSSGGVRTITPSIKLSI